MVPVGNEGTSSCSLGACATNRNESAPLPSLTDMERVDARSQGLRLAMLAAQLRNLRSKPGV